jgi:hypothetical protein
MKNLAIILFSFLLFSCSNSSSSNKEGGLVSSFLTDVKSLEDTEIKTPIIALREEAQESAAKVLEFDKDNIDEVFEKAASYSNTVIVTGDHTVVLLGDLEDCEVSGSWGHCMPMGEGYINKNGLQYQEDFIKNIIGRPDDQERWAFFFE